MSVNRVVLNETSYFGFGSRSVLADEIKTRGFKKILVVTDKDLVKFHVVDQVTAVLDDAGIAYQVFSDVKQNPTVKNVKDGLAALKVSGAEALLGVGGGSVIDTAKAIGIIATNPEFADVVSLEGVAATKSAGLP
jgi:lactaldehyde reductase